MSEDPEIEKIKQRKLEEMMRQQNQPQIEPGITDLNDANFDQIVSAENPTLVDFWAEWCGPCKMIGPALEELSNEYGGTVKIAKVNVDNSPDIARRFEVMSIPTLILFKDGEPAKRVVGAKPKPALLAELSDYL